MLHPAFPKIHTTRRHSANIHVTAPRPPPGWTHWTHAKSAKVER